MGKGLTVLTLFCIVVTFIQCRKGSDAIVQGEEPCTRHDTAYLKTPFDSWLDSAFTQNFTLTANNGQIETITLSQKKIFDAFDHPCYVSQQQIQNLNSTMFDRNIELNLSDDNFGVLNITYLRNSYMLHFRFDLFHGTSNRDSIKGNVTLKGNNLNSNDTAWLVIKDTLKVGSRVYKKVLCLNNPFAQRINDNTAIDKLYMDTLYGILRYHQINGVYWDVKK